MINLSDYPKFKADTNTKNLNITSIAVIGWNKSDTNITSVGSPIESSIYVSQQKEVLDGTYYRDMDLNVPSMSESIDFVDNKYKINNISITLSNYVANGERFSDLLEKKSIINEQVAIFWKSQNCTSLSDCYPVYIGVCRKVKHSKDNVNIQLEDFSDIYLEREVPVNLMPNTYYVDSRNATKPIPMVYGDNDAVPTPFSAGEPINEGSISKLTLHIDTHKFAANSLTEFTTMIGDSHIQRSAVYVLEDGNYYNVGAKPYNGLINRNFSYNSQTPRVTFGVNYSTIASALEGLGIDLQGVFDETGEFTIPSSTEDQETLDQIIAQQEQKISDTYDNVLRIDYIQKPKDVKLHWEWNTNSSHPPPEPTVRSYASEEDWDDGVYGEGISFNPTLAFNDSSGNIDTQSFVEASGPIAPTPIGGRAKGSYYQLIATFDSGAMPFGQSLYTEDEGNLEENPSPPDILIKAKTWVEAYIDHTIRHYDGQQHNFGVDEGHHFGSYEADITASGDNVGYGIAPNYYGSSEHIGRLWIQTGLYQVHWDRTSNKANADREWHRRKGKGTVAYNLETENKDINGNIATATAMSSEANNLNFGTGNHISTFRVADKFDIDTIHIGFGHYPLSNDLYYRSFPFNQQFLYYHNAAIRLYNIRLRKHLLVNGLTNKDYYVRVQRGRIGGVYGSGDYSHGYSWIIRHMLTNELGIPKEVIDDEAYNRIQELEESLSTDELAFCQVKGITAKKLLQKICQSTQFTTKCKYNGKFSFEYLKSSYNESEVNGTIKNLDVINYNYSTTSPRKIFTRIQMYYHKDYGKDKYNAYLEDNIDKYVLNNGLNEYSMDYYKLADYDSDVQQARHTSTTKVFKSDFIRSKSIWNQAIVGASMDLTNVNDGYATEYAKFLLLNSCQQKLLIDVTLPLSYLWIETGDVIKFDELLGNLKAYGNDYTKLQQINGMWCYPAFIVTKVNKSTKSIKVSLMQLWYLNDDNNHNWYAEEEEQVIYGCTNSLAVNYNPNATIDNGTCFLLGDPNQDGVINVVDIINLVNVIVQGDATTVTENTPYYIQCMDLNQDGIINVIDIIAMVNIIISDSEEGTSFYGCTIPDALNYDVNATNDDGSCIMPYEVCSSPNAINYDATSGQSNQQFPEDDAIQFYQDIENNDVCIFSNNEVQFFCQNNYYDFAFSFPDADESGLILEQGMNVFNPFLFGDTFETQLPYEGYAIIPSGSGQPYAAGTMLQSIGESFHYLVFFYFYLNNATEFENINSRALISTNSETQDEISYQIGNDLVFVFNFNNWANRNTHLSPIQLLAYYMTCNTFGYPLGLKFARQGWSDSGIWSTNNILYSTNDGEYNYENLINTEVINFTENYEIEGNDFNALDKPNIKMLNCGLDVHSDSESNEVNITMTEWYKIIEVFESYNDYAGSELYPTDTLNRSEYVGDFLPSLCYFTFPLKNTKPFYETNGEAQWNNIDDRGYYFINLKNIQMNNPNDKIKIYIIDNGNEMNSTQISDQASYFGGDSRWCVYKDGTDSATAQVNVGYNSHNAQILYEAEYYANEIYDDWDNSILTTGTIPGIRLEVNPLMEDFQYANIISFIIVFLPADENIGQTISFSPPEIRAITQQEYTDAIQ